MKWKTKKTTWVFLYIKYSKFWSVSWNISLSTNLLFLKSVIPTFFIPFLFHFLSSLRHIKLSYILELIIFLATYFTKTSDELVTQYRIFGYMKSASNWFKRQVDQGIFSYFLPNFWHIWWFFQVNHDKGSSSSQV